MGFEVVIFAAGTLVGGLFTAWFCANFLPLCLPPAEPDTDTGLPFARAMPYDERVDMQERIIYWQHQAQAAGKHCLDHRTALAELTKAMALIASQCDSYTECRNAANSDLLSDAEFCAWCESCYAKKVMQAHE